jgi:hypothetical protein
MSEIVADAAGYVVMWQIENAERGVYAWGDTLSAALRHAADCLVGVAHDGKPYVFEVEAASAELMDMLHIIQAENPKL